MPKSGKNYRNAKKNLPTDAVSVAEAVAAAKSANYAKFDGSIEIAIKTNADPKYNDQNVRTTVVLPHGTGKKVRVAAIVATDDQVKQATEAGADIAGYEKVLEMIKSEKFDFDILITTPDLIRELAPHAKSLGPKGLMPSPKAGTVTTNIGSTIDEIKKGRCEIKLDKTGNIHAAVGRISFDDAKLTENIETFIKAVEDARPSGVKGKFLKTISLAPTMGPSVRIISN